MIEKDGQPNVVVAVEIFTLEEIVSAAETVAERYSETVCILLASTPIENALLVSVVIPGSLSRVLRDGNSDEESFNHGLIGFCTQNLEKYSIVSCRKWKWTRDACFIQSVSLSYPHHSEWVPEKLVDQVRSTAFQYLKQVGLYKEPEDDGEEIEYGFDDI